MITNTDMGYKPGSTTVVTKEHTNKVRRMVKVNTHGKTTVITMGTGWITK